MTQDPIDALAGAQRAELIANQHKGDLFDWCNGSSFQTWLYEFEYHKAKLITAIMNQDKDRTTEYCADLANYLAAINARSEPYRLQVSGTLTEALLDQPAISIANPV